MVHMTEWPDLLARTYDVVRDPVALLEEPLLGRPTPCSEWTVRDVFEHLLGTLGEIRSDQLQCGRAWSGSLSPRIVSRSGTWVPVLE